MLVFTWHDPFLGSFTGNFESGKVGVGFFFLLSGFILTYTYHAAFREKIAAGAARDFYVARFARIYPVHIVAMILAVVVLSLSDAGAHWRSAEPRALEIVTQTLLVQAWLPNLTIAMGANSVDWTISVEAFFYSLFPLLAYLGNRYVAGLSICRIAALALALWFATAVFAVGGHWRSGELERWSLYVLPLTRLPDFLVGMLLGYIFLRPNRMKLPLSATAVECCSLAIAATAIATISVVPTRLSYAVWMMPWLSVLVLSFAYGRGAISRALSRPAFVQLGKVSFAFYMVHLSVRFVVEPFFPRPAPLETAVIMAVSLGLSYALFRFVETPARRWIRSKSSPLQASNARFAFERVGQGRS
jgi:peptidoglycan/LPS O-acetylase OafA/YrhL